MMSDTPSFSFVDDGARTALATALSDASVIRVGELPVRILFCREVTSTMDVSRSFEPIANEHPQQIIAASLPLTVFPLPSLSNQHCVVSLSQTQGRGRDRREWKSQIGTGIFTTFHFNVADAASGLLGYPLAVAVGVAETVLHFGAHVGLKWPNDIWSITPERLPIGKLAGILIESSSVNDVSTSQRVGVGVGLNLEPVNLDLPYPRSALRDITDRAFDYNSVFVRLLTEIAEVTNRFFGGEKDLVLRRWKELCFLWGRSVDVVAARSTMRVKCIDLDQDGGLVVEDASTKQRQTLYSHEVSLRMDSFAE